LVAVSGWKARCVGSVVAVTVLSAPLFPAFMWMGNGAMHDVSDSLAGSLCVASVWVAGFWVAVAKESDRTPSRYRSAVYAQNYRNARERGDGYEMRFWATRLGLPPDGADSLAAKNL
jgi:hypothetical protein